MVTDACSRISLAYASTALLAVLVLLLNTNGAEAQSSSAENVSEQVGAYLSAFPKWVWPVTNEPGPENLIYSILSSWCGSTYVDAVREAADKASLFERLRLDRDQRFSEWMRCQQERNVREKEQAASCQRSRSLQALSFEKERSHLAAECDADRKLLLAELEACELKLKKKEEVLCAKEVALEKSSCQHALSGLRANLSACHDRASIANGSRLADLALGAQLADEERAAAAVERRSLMAEVAHCRPARSHAESRLREVLADGTIDSLEDSLLWVHLLLFLLLIFLTASAALVVYIATQETQPSGSGSYGWIGVLPPSKLRMTSADTAKEYLERSYEGSRTRGSRLSILLATSLNYENEAGTPNVFLLVPVNIRSSRRFSLFNTGGDYTAHAERAQDVVSKALPKARLVVVLYNGNGTLFTESTLQSLRLTPDKAAYEAVPKDMDFPRSHNLVVVWLDSMDGSLHATDSERESELTSLIRAQPWAQYLATRSTTGV